MKRDPIKTAEKITGKIDPNYDLSMEDLEELLKICTPYDSPKTADAIVTAFKYGYALGSRAEAKASKTA